MLFAVPAGAHAADVDINSAPPVYNPQTITIAPGDSVIWHHNNDPLFNPRGVRFDDEDAMTQTCDPTALNGTTCTRTFSAPGRFRYFDPSTCASGPAADCSVNGLVVVYVPPTASFSAGPNPQLRGQAINFDASASASPGGSITNYSWDFGDSTGVNGVAVSHAYTAAGAFNVKLFVTDDQGNVAIQTQQVTVTVPDGDADGVNDDLDKCATTPGPGPNGCPLAPVLVPGPIVTTATAARALATGAVGSGVTVIVNCSAACTAVLTLTPASAARRSALAGTLSTKTVALPGGGSQMVTLTFSRAIQKALTKAKTSKLRLRVEVTDALGRKQTRTSTITLKPLATIGKLPAIGISDQQAATFTDPLFQVLRVKYARLVTPWNSIFSEPDRLDAWLQAARFNGARPLVSFSHARGDQCPKKPCKAPSAGQYKRAWTAFHKKYSWVKDISPWNEINSATQPTGKKPELAAAYYNVVRAKCRGCSIVAADLLDASNIRRYVAAFLKTAKGKPRLWGLHNYTDTNRFRSRGTNALLQTVKGTVWLTETGGIVKFVTQDGKVALPKSESRAKRAMDYMFRLAQKNAKRVKRIYVYQWKINNPFDRFDAGIVRPDGTPRPSFDVLSLNASIARKR